MPSRERSATPEEQAFCRRHKLLVEYLSLVLFVHFGVIRNLRQVFRLLFEIKSGKVILFFWFGPSSMNLAASPNDPKLSSSRCRRKRKKEKEKERKKEIKKRRKGASSSST